MPQPSTQPFPRLEAVWPLVVIAAMYGGGLLLGVDTNTEAMTWGFVMGLGYVGGGLIDYAVLQEPQPPLRLVHPRLLWWGLGIIWVGRVIFWLATEPNRHFGVGMMSLGTIYFVLGVFARLRIRRIG